MGKNKLGRPALIAGVVATVVALAGCSSPPAAVTGVMTGRADACGGAPAYLPTAQLHIYKSGSLVTNKSVPNGSTYKFVLPAGTYLVTNSSLQMAHQVKVRPGGTVHQDIPNDCP
jgi:hypothetical protein